MTSWILTSLSSSVAADTASWENMPKHHLCVPILELHSYRTFVCPCRSGSMLTENFSYSW